MDGGFSVAAPVEGMQTHQQAGQQSQAKSGQQEQLRQREQGLQPKCSIINIIQSRMVL